MRSAAARSAVVRVSRSSCRSASPSASSRSKAPSSSASASVSASCEREPCSRSSVVLGVARRRRCSLPPGAGAARSRRRRAARRPRRAAARRPASTAPGVAAQQQLAVGVGASRARRRPAGRATANRSREQPLGVSRGQSRSIERVHGRLGGDLAAQRGEVGLVEQVGPAAATSSPSRSAYLPREPVDDPRANGGRASLCSREAARARARTRAASVRVEPQRRPVDASISTGASGTACRSRDGGGDHVGHRQPGP